MVKQSRRLAMTAPSQPDLLFDLVRPHKTQVLLEVVEPRRLMERDEQNYIERWRDFIHAIREKALPAHGGHVHKSLGDGLILEFDTAWQAAAAALAIQAISRQHNDALPVAAKLQVRAAVVPQAPRSQHAHEDADFALRLAALAGPGEIVASAAVRDQLTGGLDGDIEDLGPSRLEGADEITHVYRISPPRPHPAIVALRSMPQHPCLAVVPFTSLDGTPHQLAIGELLAEALIARLGRTRALRVLSRLSTRPYGERQWVAADLASTLGATHVLSGAYAATGTRLVLSAELVDARTGVVVWADRLRAEVGDLLQAESETCHSIAAAAHSAIMHAQVQKSLFKPLPALDSCSLLFGAIELAHRVHAADFARARHVLEALVDRHPHCAQSRAWLAQWHVLRIVRGLSEAPELDARRAIEQTERGLEAEPECPIALAIQGHALCHVSKDGAGALQRIDHALALQPSEPLAWLYKSVWSSKWGSPAGAVLEAEAASALSPLDPMAYYFDMVHATALSAHGEREQANKLMERAARAHRATPAATNAPAAS
jgi:adenylate cyclase